MKVGIKKGTTFTEEHKRNIGLANRGKKRTEKSKKKISNALKGKKAPNRKYWLNKKRLNMVGKKHWFWKGGITPINFRIRNSLEYKIWRRAVFERDGYVCVWGGKEHGNKLQAHHIKPFAYFPELRFDANNGRTLCRQCHMTTETYKARALKLAKAKLER